MPHEVPLNRYRYNDVPKLRRPAYRAAHVQPDVQDLHGPGGGCGFNRLPAAGDGAGQFVNFENVLDTTRKKLPFGIAQVGKSFRNEITTGNFIFRSREFEQMEIEYFVKPGTDEEWFDYWVNERLNWYVDLGIKKENLRLRPHDKEELAHYARGCFDVEYHFPIGWSEIEGIANRGDYRPHAALQVQRQDAGLFRRRKGRTLYPLCHRAVIRRGPHPAGRAVRCLRRGAADKETRVVLHIKPEIAPIKVAVLPLSRNAKLLPKSKEVHAMLRPFFMTQYDDAQSIGRRYRRQDEIGTPFCVTIDFDSLDDNQVTIRERDSMQQVRVPIPELLDRLKSRFNF